MKWNNNGEQMPSNVSQSVSNVGKGEVGNKSVSVIQAKVINRNYFE
jgi:hypothetical protein